MAEEKVRCLPDSPDVNRSWRRVSTRKLSFLYTEETLVPNYLRSSTGSCHDACKYGRKKHESDVSPHKRVNRSFSGTLSFDSPLKKKALTKSLLSSSLGSDGGCEHEVSRVEHFASRVCDGKKQNAERSRRKAVVSLSDCKRKKTVSHSFKSTGVSRRRALEMVEHNKRVTALKLKSVAQTAAMALRRSTVKVKKVSGGIKASEPKKVVVPLRATMSSKRYTRGLKTKKESNSLSSVPLKRTRKLVDDKCKDLVEEKTLYVIKMNTGNETVASDQNQRCVLDQPIDDPKSEKSQDEAECVVTESLQEEEAEEVDEANDESPQEVEEEEEASDESPQAIENNTRQGKSKPLSTESALKGKSMRLRFKRGKVMEVGSQDNNSPRKLKFKKGKIVTRTDTSSKTSSQRSLKTKETNFNNEKEQQQHEPKPSEVVLKHQDTEEKRDSKALLFNNVIEETANKLVETRKSKVKALVGAFESVISLQERNSSPTT
ncbi:unnamed protein product [Eruca vesicaria subsp. sativa]|uniref:Calmodulin-binding domain-containing protein n=1 Tax=Eruca vesicaria subsp. sativa TaxID=29727 RepID=A0ABC8KQH6_ERUVS|nr:unnamed protein product [Eruca vesicaria subsp. sativa]